MAVAYSYWYELLAICINSILHDRSLETERRHIVQPGMYFQKLKFSVTFDPNAVYTSFFYHTIALKILYPSIYFLCPRLSQKASFEDTRQFRQLMTSQMKILTGW